MQFTKGDRHSILGYAFRFYGGTILWSSKCQQLVALSSTKAEYIAVTHAAKEAIWLRQLLSDITLTLTCPTPIFCDNNGMITLSKNTIYHPRTKHIDIQYHYIRELLECRSITLIQVNTTENVADIFTKPLPHLQFEGVWE
jgi:hypothetical protein